MIDKDQLIGYILFLRQDYFEKNKKVPEYVVMSKNLFGIITDDTLFCADFKEALKIAGMKIILTEEKDILIVGCNILDGVYV